MRALICQCFSWSLWGLAKSHSRLWSLGLKSCLNATSLSFQGSPTFEDPGEGPDAWAAEGPQK